MLKRSLKEIHRFIKYTVFSIAILLICLVPYSVKAADSGGLVIYQHEHEGQQHNSVAVCVDAGDDGRYLLSVITGEEDVTSAEAIVGEKSFPIKLTGTYETYENTIGFWTCEDDIWNYVNPYKAAYPVKGEQVTAIYIAQGDNGLEIRRLQTTIEQSYLLKEGDPNSGYVILFDTIDDEIYKNSLFLTLENANGECLGIIVENGVVCPLYYDDNVFNSGTTEEKQIETQTPKQTEKTAEDKTEKKEAQTKNNGVGTKQKTDGQVKDEFEKLGGALALFIVSILFGVFLIRKWFKKNKQTQPNPAPPEPVPPKPIPPEPVPPEPVPPGPTIQINPKPEKKLFLYIKGGYMTGQVYPIENDKITIGRDSKCRIHYPKDYAGVSTVHASVFRLNGKIYLKDENSSYGTYLKTEVGAKKLEPAQPQELHEGSEFYIAEKKNAIRVVNGVAHK